MEHSMRDSGLLDRVRETVTSIDVLDEPVGLENLSKISSSELPME
jgi:hypothetical protein